MTASTLVNHKPLLGLVSIRNMISCEYCESKFSRKDTLNRHLKSKHTNHIIWCEYCLFTTNRKDEFVKHMKKNHGEKDKYEGGSEQNTDEQAGPSSYKCSQCDFTCIEKSELKKHVDTFIR